MPSTVPLRWLLGLALLSMSGVGCKGTRDYKPSVELLRVSVVERDAAGKPLMADAEIKYADCPGTQLEVARGGADFAACMAQYKPGTRVEASLRWYKHKDGHFDWDLLKIGACPLSGEPHSNGSFEVVQECEEIKVHGGTIGFRCLRQPDRQLADKCPWFRR